MDIRHVAIAFTIATIASVMWRRLLYFIFVYCQIRLLTSISRPMFLVADWPALIKASYLRLMLIITSYYSFFLGTSLPITQSFDTFMLTTFLTLRSQTVLFAFLIITVPHLFVQETYHLPFAVETTTRHLRQRLAPECCTSYMYKYYRNLAIKCHASFV